MDSHKIQEMRYCGKVLDHCGATNAAAAARRDAGLGDTVGKF
jgi:hypothetical protein